MMDTNYLLATEAYCKAPEHSIAQADAGELVPYEDEMMDRMLFNKIKASFTCIR